MQSEHAAIDSPGLEKRCCSRDLSPLHAECEALKCEDTHAALPDSQHGNSDDVMTPSSDEAKHTLGIPRNLLDICTFGDVEYCSRGSDFLETVDKSVVVAAEQDAKREGSISTLPSKILPEHHWRIQVFRRMRSWTFDTFHFTFLTEGHPLVNLAYPIFDEEELFTPLKINRECFRRFLLELERSYRPVAYHNRLHAADVKLRTLYYLINTDIAHFEARHLADNYDRNDECRLANRIAQAARSGDVADVRLKDGKIKTSLSKLELAACLIAAAGHDTLHPGRTNFFMTSIQHPLGSHYGGVSVLEHHHFHSLRKLLEQPGCDFLAHLPTEDYDFIMKMIRELVVATDVSMKGQYEATLKEAMTKTRDTGFRLLRRTEPHNSYRQMTLNLAIRVADVAPPSTDLSNYLKWTGLLYHEFDDQMNDEKAHNIQVTGFMARSEIPSTQNGFIKVFVTAQLMLYHNAGLLPGPYMVQDGEVDEEENKDPSSAMVVPLSRVLHSSIIQTAEDNRHWWKQYREQPKATCETAATPNVGDDDDDKNDGSNNHDDGGSDNHDAADNHGDTSNSADVSRDTDTGDCVA